MKICHWCLEENPKFADSRIIPKSFFNHDGENDRKIVSYKNFPKRRPVGSYDGNILCVDCEKDFQDIDSQAAKILLQDFEDKLIPFGDKKDEIAFQIDGKYKEPIKRFLIYTLWKASVSSLKEFKNINLGAFENKIKQAIIDGTIFKDHEYSFSAFRVEKSSGNIYPRKLNKRGFSGLNYYELDFANFIFNIKIDSRITPEPLKSIAEYEHVVFNKIYETPEKRRQAMVKIVKSQK